VFWEAFGIGANCDDAVSGSGSFVFDDSLSDSRSKKTEEV